MRTPYQYALIRVMPRVDRDEFINAGVILFQSEGSYLQAKTFLSESKLRALSADVNITQVRRSLRGIERICAGDAEAGPVARMKRSDRFHWLTAPRSTMIQTSPVRTGLTDAPEVELEDLARDFVT